MPGLSLSLFLGIKKLFIPHSLPSLSDNGFLIFNFTLVIWAYLRGSVLVLLLSPLWGMGFHYQFILFSRHEEIGL